MFFNVRETLAVRFALILMLLPLGWTGAIPLQNARAAKQISALPVWAAQGLGHLAQMQVETALLVKDINPGASSSGAGSFENVDGVLYFGAYDGIYGSELWKSDGTEAGTLLVRDINPGTSSSSLRYLENVGGIFYFSAEDGVHGHELWKSDGTEEGTVLVKDINPNTNSSSPNFLTDVNGTLYFAAYDPVYGTELWKSDGTADGTVLVRDINPGSESSSPENLLNVNGMLYFSANDGDENHSTELWKSDGTSDGTVMVKDIFPGVLGSDPYNLIDINGTLYFVAQGDLNGYNDNELWKSDGTPDGTMLVKDIQPGEFPSYPQYLVNLNGTLYFCASDGIHGMELWKSDGTASGTVMVKDILPGYRGAIDSLTVLGDAIYFMANDATNGAELWKSDGTTAGTVLLKDIVPGEGSSGPESFAISNGILYFVAEDITGKELWKSDGTTAGTIYVRDINPTGDSWPDDLTDVNGTLFFSANDGVNGYELWKIGLGDPSPRTFTISGNVGVAGATLSYFDGADKTVVSDTNGDYLISIVAYSWSGTVTPSKPNYRFSPSARSYSYLMSSISNQSYGAEHVFTISGNAGVEGASISYTDGAVKYVTADSNGDYSLQVSDNWTGTIRPYKSHYLFTPGTLSFNNVQTDQPSQDFTAERFVIIYGSVGISNVTLSYYIDETLKTVTSGSTGNYLIDVPDNWSGTVTPSRTGFVFTPSSREYSNVIVDQSSQNYTWTPFVTNVNDSGAGSLRQAIANANAGMTISFDPALAGQTISLASEIQIAKNLTIDGSGLTPPVSISGNQAARIFSIAFNRTVNLNSLILKDGRMSGTNYQAFGGAIYTNELTVLTMTDVALRGNQAYQAGAVYIAPNAKVTILDSELTSNSSSSLGGAIYTQSLGKLTLKNSLLQRNEATDSGGAIYLVAAGTHLLENNTFSDNNAATAGAIMIDQTSNSNVTLRNNLFAENISTGSVNGGGALRTHMNSTPAVLQIENNTFYANQAANIGGAVWLDGGTATFTNNTFSNNQANQSGGNAGASLYIVPGGTTYLYNNIFANNTVGGECASSETPSVVGTNNLVEDGSAPCASLPETVVFDPFLGALSENGGPTLTMPLLSASLAIDAGDSSCLITDQRGMVRPQDGNNDGNAICDIGAYEAEPDMTPPTVKSIVRIGEEHTSATSVDFTIIFSEPVIDVATDDFKLAIGGEIQGADITGVVPVDTCTGRIYCDMYTVTVDTGIENGTLGLDVAADAMITDAAENPLDHQPFTPDEEYTIEKPLTLLTPTNSEILLHRRPTLDWTDVSGAANYRIVASQSSTFSPLLWKIDTIDSTYTPPANLPAGKVIYWRVRALVNGVWSPWSQTWSFTTARPPSIPVLLKPAHKALTKDYTPLLDWNDSTIPSGSAAFDHYQVQVSEDKAFPEPTLVDAVTPTSFYAPDIDLTANRRYFWRVRAFNVAGEYSSWSSPWVFFTAILPPSNLAPTDGESVPTRKPLLDWDAVEGATGYNLQISTSDSFVTLLVNTPVTADTFTPSTRLPANKIIYWRVRATGPNGPSRWTTGSFHTP